MGNDQEYRRVFWTGMLAGAITSMWASIVIHLVLWWLS